MKLLTIVVPCYNSQEYMCKCVDSLLVGGDAVEIIIVNDGSTDATAQIADRYAECYPTIVRVIHQANGGHGAAVNTGISSATGVYFKVVDSDDWVDGDAYAKILETLATLDAKGGVDLLLSNYVYEKVDKRHKTVVRYTGVVPQNRLLTWDQIGSFRMGQYILMHAIIYRTKLLRGSGLVLPRHTFYVDNLYAYIPLRDVRTIYYLNVNFYRYYIGREGQSVQENKMIERIDQQLRVNKMMVDSIELETIAEPRQRDYMCHYLEIVTTVSSILLMRSKTQENMSKKQELWSFIRQRDEQLYTKLRLGLFGQMLHLPGRTGRSISMSVYKVSQKVVGFS